jgi:uncharacterized peroxidase-related enzyme
MSSVFPYQEPLMEEKLKSHSDAPKPYIKLDNSMGGGIVSLFTYDREGASALTRLGQVLMRRGGRSLSVGERELIFAFTSKLNSCQFCLLSHAQAAALLYGEQANRILFQDEDYNLSKRLRALLVIAACVQNMEESEIAGAIADAKLFGVSDQEIYDTVMVASFASMCNRMVSMLGTTYKKGEPEEGGKSLVKYGYVMSIGRFFSEVLPKLWVNFWSGK